MFYHIIQQFNICIVCDINFVTIEIRTDELLEESMAIVLKSI